MLLKKIRLIILATDTESVLFTYDNLLYRREEPQLSFNAVVRKDQNQHLYFISDEAIRKDDWYLTFEGAGFHTVVGVPRKCEDDNYSFSYCKKIIATTDNNLNTVIPCPDGREECEVLHLKHLPLPTKSFLDVYVRDYNKGIKIEWVNVAYELGEWLCYPNCTENARCDKYQETKLIIDPDNNLNIRKIKESWNIDEVKELIRQAYVSGYENGYVKGDWHNAIEDIYKEKL